MNDNLDLRLKQKAEQKQREEKYQVRFWSRPIKYQVFTDCCRRNGLTMQDAFNEFMDWYIEKHDLVLVTSNDQAVTNI